MFGRRRRRESAEREAAARLYAIAVERARDPIFYTRFGVPDSVDGRFEMIALHVWLVLRRLKAATAQPSPRAQALSQALFDEMFEDMDQNLREMGAGDLGVGRRVKVMAKAFYGRMDAYDDGLAEAGDAVLHEALTRNLYGTVDPDPAHLDMMSGYLRQQADRTAGLTEESLLAGSLEYAAIEVPA